MSVMFVSFLLSMSLFVRKICYPLQDEHKKIFWKWIMCQSAMVMNNKLKILHASNKWAFLMKLPIWETIGAQYLNSTENILIPFYYAHLKMS